MTFNFTNLQLMITFALVLLYTNIQISFASRCLLLHKNKLPTDLPSFPPLFSKSIIENVPNPLLPTIPSFQQPVGVLLNPPAFSLPMLPPLPKLPPLPSLPLVPLPPIMPCSRFSPSRSSSSALLQPIPQGENVAKP
ncbi:uncharacterized protein HKW66_Vig0087730 [Vigna angularis]|uniref:Uncharacterized protein n=3 Tax=Phaseolus angularis TaxID=3914 RepID=A0A8T0KGG9_PHAAN|nr:uncharacterized protein HKW66_Vig0087730 [Vigna angularis]BAT79965.1 hypothetical protein VIGAN_02291600 [Vigna angularis var. angularis]